MGTKRGETYRLKKLCQIEASIRELGYARVAGVDEAGRGPLAGPVVAAACILPVDYTLLGVDDSKKLSESSRYALYQELTCKDEIRLGVGVVEAVEIDRLNIHQATLMVMKRAVLQLVETPDFLLVDGSFVPDCGIPSESVVGGEGKVQSIAAASIMAKVTRDHIMEGYDKLYPGYGFADHKGYGTKAHFDALKRLGASPIHRKSFGPIKERMK